MIELRYRFGRASVHGEMLIVGKAEDPNPIQPGRTIVLPFDKMRVGDALFFHKKELPELEVKEARSAAKRFIRQYAIELFGFVDSPNLYEIVRIR